jgi:capsular exopolysaccharide synthesis family protein
MSGGDIWRVICANAWLIALFVAISAVAGYFANDYLEKHDSTYTAAGTIRILPAQSPDPIHPAPSPDAMSLDIEKATETQRFRSELLVDDLMKDLDNPIRQTNWWNVTCGKNPEKAHELLSMNLGVDPMPGSQLMKISFTAADKSDTPVMVTAVVDRAIRDQREFVRDKYDTDRKRIYDLKTRYEIELRNAIEDVKLKVEELTQLGANPFGGGSAKDMELAARVQEKIALQSMKIEMDNAASTIQQYKEHGEVPPQVQRMVDEDRDIISTKETLDGIETRLSEIDGEGQKSPAYQQLLKTQELFRKKLDDQKADKTRQYTDEYTSGVLGQKQIVDQKLEHTNSEVSRLEAEVADIANKTAALKSRQDDQGVYREFVKEYDKGLQDLDQLIRQNEVGSMEWFARPREPSTRSFPKLTNIMGMAIFIGLALSLGIAFLRELTDTTVRSPRDIIRVGQMNFLGMVPHESDDPQSSGARLPLVIFEAPHSIMAEQLRQVRTRLQHAASLDTTRSILVTSPSPGDGKSTICVNLAAGLALNGRRILLVDSNFRRPELHRIFGIGNEAGFSDVLNDVNAFAASVRETSVPNLSVMASGPKPTNPTELLESQLLLDFIERALEEYDHVIFDSGPMLFVSESVALAPRVDGVVTVVRARSSSRGVLQRMRDGLRAVKAEHLGIVLNGVRSQAGGYYGRSIKTYYEYQNAE